MEIELYLRSILEIIAELATLAPNAATNKRQCTRLQMRTHTLINQLEINTFELDQMDVLMSLLESLTAAKELILKHNNSELMERLFTDQRSYSHEFTRSHLCLYDTATELGLTYPQQPEEDRLDQQDDFADATYALQIMQSMQASELKAHLQRLTKDSEKWFSLENSSFVAIQNMIQILLNKKHDQVEHRDPYCLDEDEINFVQSGKRGGPKKLGSGSFGTVYEAVFRGKSVAVKELQVNTNAHGVRTDVQREVQLISPLCHPHVVRLFGYCIGDDQQALLVIEFLAGGTLLNKIEANSLPEAMKLDIIQQVVSGMVYLHSLKPNAIIHRDLKSSNIMFDHNAQVRIIDFGMARAKQGSQYQATSRGLAGTLRYSAPELLRATESYSRASDVYAFGVIVFEMDIGHVPLRDVAEAGVAAAVQTGRVLQEADAIVNRDLRVLCTLSISLESKSRPTFATIDAVLRSAKQLNLSIEHLFCQDAYFARRLKTSLEGSPEFFAQQLINRLSTRLSFAGCKEVLEELTSCLENHLENISFAEFIVCSELPEIIRDCLRENNVPLLIAAASCLRPLCGLDRPDDEDRNRQLYAKLRARLLQGGVGEQLLCMFDNRVGVTEITSDCICRLLRDPSFVKLCGKDLPLSILVKLLSHNNAKLTFNLLTLISRTAFLRSIVDDQPDSLAVIEVLITQLCQIIQTLDSGEESCRLLALTLIQDLIGSPRGDCVLINSLVQQTLVSTLRSGTLQAKINASDVLLVLAQVSSLRMPLARLGIILPTIDLLVRGPLQAKETTAGILSWLSAHPDINRAIAAAGAIQALVQLTLLERGSMILKEYASNTLSNLTTMRDCRPLVIKAGGVFNLTQLLSNGSCAAQCSSLRALYHLSCLNTEVQVSIFEYGAAPSLADILQSPAEEGKILALKLLELTTGSYQWLKLKIISNEKLITSLFEIVYLPKSSDESRFLAQSTLIGLGVDKKMFATFQKMFA